MSTATERTSANSKRLRSIESHRAASARPYIYNGVPQSHRRLREQRASPELLHRVVAAGMKRMAPQQPAHTHVGTAQRAVAANRFQGVGRASGREPAGWREHRRDDQLIAAYQSD